MVEMLVVVAIGSLITRARAHVDSGVVVTGATITVAAPSEPVSVTLDPATALLFDAGSFARRP